MNEKMNGLSRIAAMKVLLGAQRARGEISDEPLYGFPVPGGTIQISFRFSEDFKDVLCIASSSPIGPTMRENALQAKKINNEWRALPMDLNAQGQFFTIVACPVDLFFSEGDAWIEFVLVRPAADAVFNVMVLASALDDSGPGRTPAGFAPRDTSWN